MKRITFPLMVFFAIILCSCQKKAQKEETPPLQLSINVSPTLATITLNRTQQIVATVSPGYAPNKTVIWSSDATSVATVTTSGLVTGVGVGSAIITARTQDGNKTATCSITVSEQAVAPLFAIAVGYTVNTFTSTFDNSQVDRTNTQNSGYNWYINPFNGTPTPVAGIVLHSDNSVTLQSNDGSASGIHSTGKKGNSWVGTAFGGGGYFEATLKFNPYTLAQADFDNGGWPAWWSLAIEAAAKLPTAQWPGQVPGYNHNIEPDFLEYMSTDPTLKHYTGAMHDWSGVWPNTVNKGTPWAASHVVVPPATDFNQYHTYGWLWVPATATTQGYAKYYFDGQLSTNQVFWTQYTNQAPTPPTQMDPWTFGILDQQHLTLTLSSGAPMTVKSVNVWQKDDKHNGRDGLLPVTITVPPTDRSVAVGSAATFSVVATGTPNPTTYQWRKGGVSIPGANGASYTTPVTTLADNGAVFSVLVMNSFSSETSSNATLTVK